MSIGAKRVIKAVAFSVLALVVLVAVVITVLTVMYNVYYDKPLNDNANTHETTYLPNGLIKPFFKTYDYSYRHAKLIKISEETEEYTFFLYDESINDCTVTVKLSDQYASNYGKYETGKDYIILLSYGVTDIIDPDNKYDVLYLGGHIYCPIEDMAEKSRYYEHNLYDILVHEGMPTDLTRKEFVEYVMHLSTECDYMFDTDNAHNTKLRAPFADDGSALAHVRLSATQVNADSTDQYYEYSFDVIEWIRGGDGEKEVTAYLEKDHYNRDTWGISYYPLDKNEYVSGTEYVVKLTENVDGYRLSFFLYCPLDNMDTAHSYWFELGEFVDGYDEMDKTAFIAYLKEASKQPLTK